MAKLPKRYEPWDWDADKPATGVMKETEEGHFVSDVDLVAVQRENAELREKLEGLNWIKCSDKQPQESGRYGIVYRFKGNRSYVFTGDWDVAEGRWLSIPQDNEILYWCEYPPMPHV